MPTTLNNTGVNFNDGTVQTTARTASNTVTSVNGQVGAVTVSTTPPTTVDAVGVYQKMYYAATGPNTANASAWLTYGQTIAGSSLRYNATSGRSGDVSTGTTVIRRSGNTTWAGGGTAASGTWRVMEHGQWFSARFNGENNDGTWADLLFVRIA